jgi:hypothetical protein
MPPSSVKISDEEMKLITSFILTFFDRYTALQPTGPAVVLVIVWARNPSRSRFYTSITCSSQSSVSA